MKRSFPMWLEAVDAAVVRLVGMGLDDLPDVPTLDWYEDGVSPESAARNAVKAAM